MVNGSNCLVGEQLSGCHPALVQAIYGVQCQGIQNAQSTLSRTVLTSDITLIKAGEIVQKNLDQKFQVCELE